MTCTKCEDFGAAEINLEQLKSTHINNQEASLGVQHPVLIAEIKQSHKQVDVSYVVLWRELRHILVCW